MDSTFFDYLRRCFREEGPNAAIDRLCAKLREQKDYASLFYALLMRKRHELGVSPVPTGPAQDLPTAVHQQYEDAIREAARLVGGLYLEERAIPQAWVYFRMIGEPASVASAIDKFQPAEGDDIGPIVEIAYHEGVNPRKGFDWILERYGICNAITTVTGQDVAMPADVRAYCLKRLVRALYNELHERLRGEIARHEGTPPEEPTVVGLMKGRDWLFEDNFYHIDMSHLSAVVQMSIYLARGDEIALARELCAYGQRLSPQFRQQGDPPFEDMYRDYAAYLAILTGEDVEKNLGHFRSKAEDAEPEIAGTRPAEVLVNLLLRLERPAEALAVARRHLAQADNRPLICPGIAELCQRAGDYRTLADVSRERNDPVNFVAGLLGAPKPN